MCLRTNCRPSKIYSSMLFSFFTKCCKNTRRTDRSKTEKACAHTRTCVFFYLHLWNMLIDSQLYTKGDKFQMIAQLNRASEASCHCICYKKEARKSKRCFHFIRRFCVHILYRVSLIFCVSALQRPNLRLFALNDSNDECECEQEDRGEKSSIIHREQSDGQKKEN